MVASCAYPNRIGSWSYRAKPAMTIEQTIQRARQGDEKAIAALYEMHADVIYRYILYRVPTSHDAEDLTAEVFLRMVEGLPKYKITGAPFESWLYRIASARIADFYRRNKRQQETMLDERISDSQP